SHLQPFEERLLDVVKQGHLHHISLRPRLDLHYEDEVADIGRARRLAKGRWCIWPRTRSAGSGRR
ncbi:hypothetical protein Q6A58_36210, partial [Pseudomonas aeruginosa]